MKYIVTLSSCGNTDYGECSYEEMSPAYLARAATIEECSKRVRNYIEDYGLGSGQWNGGHVYESNGKYVGRVSYNGKFHYSDIHKTK